MSSSALLSALRHPLVPFIAGGAALAAAALGSITMEMETAAPAQEITPKVEAYATAELATPPAPGSFAVSADTPAIAEPAPLVATNDCVSALQGRVAQMRLEYAEGGTTVAPVHVPVLARLSDEIMECEEAYVMVAGHADGLGSDETNMALSWARADHALNQLVAFGVDPGVVEAVGYGATTPLAQGSDEEDPADRRVEFHVFRVKSELR